MTPKNINDAANLVNADNDETPVYEPPTSSWRITDFMNADPSEIRAKVVDCKTCPVFLLCESGEGGTGWVCAKCGSTAVFVDNPETGTLPDDVLVLDCSKHKFEKKRESEKLECALCSGGVMELEILARGSKNHLIRTVHATPSIEQRQTVWRKAHETYMKEFTQKEAEKAAKAQGRSTDESSDES